MYEFGNFLYSLRREKGLTQLELAKLLNVTNKAVSKWETGETMPETSLLLPLSDILGVTVDELLKCKKQPNKNSTDISDDERKDEIINKSNIYQTNNNMNLSQNNKHLFMASKENGKTFLEKVSGAVCATVVLISLSIYFFIGILYSLWSPCWVIIPISALSCGIISIIFNLFDAEKKQQKLARGEKIYIGSACGMVMLSCIIVYLLIGSILNLWHPYWIILILGLSFCGIVGAFGEVYKYKNSNKNDN